MEETASFTAEQAAAANRILRAELGLGPQEFSTEQFVGMISEEIEKLRASGKTDDEIVRLLNEGVGVTVSPDSIRRFYADEAQRIGYR